MSDTSTILHPVRMRIVQQLLSDGPLTPAQVHSAMGDVPIATVYRHIKILKEAGMIVVDNEKPVRGAVELTYRLADGFNSPSAKDVEDLGRKELRDLFTVFATGLIYDFDAYLDHSEGTLEEDRVSFAQADFWASDEEVDEFFAHITQELRKLASNGRSSGRRKRKLSTVLVPRPEDVSPDAGVPS